MSNQMGETSGKIFSKTLSKLIDTSIFLMICNGRGEILEHSPNLPELFHEKNNLFDVIENLKDFFDQARSEDKAISEIFETKSHEKFSLTIIPMTDEKTDEKNEAFFIIGEVLTQKLLIDEYLSQKIETLSMYLEFAPVFFVVLNQHGNIEYINAWALEKTGYKLTEVLGRNWFDIFIPDEIKENLKNVFKLIMEGKVELVQTYENEILTMSGNSIIVLWENKLLVQDGKSYGAISVGVDVTKNRKRDFEEEIIIKLLNTFSESNYQMSAAKIGNILSEKCNIKYAKAELTSHNGQFSILFVDNLNISEESTLQKVEHKRKIDDRIISLTLMYDKLPKLATERCLENILNILFSYIDRIYYIQKLEEASFKDPLTGLYNRRYFMLSLRNEIRRVKRYSTESTVVMIDLDGLKSINDKYGHDKGDIAIKSLAHVMISNTRGTDVCARFGGDEFVIILPQTNLLGAKKILERMRKELEQINNKLHEPFKISFSAGVTLIDKSDDDEGISVLKRADELLYKAKSSGKNIDLLQNMESAEPSEGSIK
ncbi:MAG: diguanylate cyclase [Fervidobacterium sp.]